MITRAYLSIGDVLTLLREEFPDVTISKIRFLESQGLVNPERSPSGYRKFYEQDVERLRWVLRQQREHFLPLKVIRDRLAQESGETVTEAEPPAAIAALLRPAVHAASHEEHRGENGVDGSPHHVASPTTVLAQDRGPTVAPARPATERRPLLFASAGERVAEPVAESAAAPTAAGPTAGAPAMSAPTPAPPPAPAPAPPRAPSHAATAPRAPEMTTDPAKAPPAPAAPEPARPSAALPSPHPAPSVAPREQSSDVSGASMGLDELCAASGLDRGEIASLEGFGLVEGVTVGGVVCYDEEALVVARLVASFARYGIEPRHLRLYRNAVERETGLIEQIVTPMLRQRNPEARQRAVDAAADLAKLGEGLRSSLLRREIRRLLGH